MANIIDYLDDANEKIDKENYDQALTILDTAFNESTTDEDKGLVLFLRGYTLFLKNEIDNSILIMKKAADYGEKEAVKQLKNIFNIDYTPSKLSSSVKESPLTAAVKVYQEGRFEEAMKMFITLANQGDAQAMYNLGIMYMSGQGTPKNDKTAFDWYSKAAHSGHPDAINNVASFYWEGIGVEKNQQKALEYFKSAAEKGSAPAKDFMARYEAASKGSGTTLNDALNLYQSGQFPQARQLLEKLAGSFDLQAMFYLGVMYAMGDGVEKNAKTAFNWFLQSAEFDFAMAQSNVGHCYQFGNGVEINEKLAVEWYTKAARNGSAEGLCNLGACYYDGTGVNQDKEIGYGYIKAAADKGCERAADLLNELKDDIVVQNILKYCENIGKEKAKNEKIMKYVEMGLELLSNVITGEIDKRR